MIITFAMLVMNTETVYILGIESSCDDTSAAVSANDKILANIVAGQHIHRPMEEWFRNSHHVPTSRISSL